MSAVLNESPMAKRPMAMADVDEVTALDALAYPSPWSKGIFQDCLRAGYCSWVFTQEDCIIGYGVMSVGAGEAHILNVCVNPEMQGQGLGRQIVRYLIDLAERHEASTVFLEVRATNKTAISLYDSIGFNELGIRRNYYPAPGGREDALLMALELRWS